VELRATKPEDLPGLSALFELRFGHPLTPEEWRWKYEQVPGEARSWVAVAPGGEVIAHAGALCLPGRWSGGEAGVWQLVDFAGTTAKRGLRPAFVELGRALLADLPRPNDAPFLFGFPSERHFRLGGKVFGYQPLTEIPIWAGELPEPAPGEGETEKHDLAFAGAQAIWEGCTVLGVRRTAELLNWRYYARPHRYYRFYRLLAGERSGLAVFGFVGEEARAAELWLPPGKERGREGQDPFDWAPSLRAVAADLRAMGLRTWRFWSSAQEGLDELFAALGLETRGERQFVGCRGREGGADGRAAAFGFTYSMGDYDLV
jgi:hypothetical protein